MAETSDIYHDYRVQKEATSLAAAGYAVTVYGFRSRWRTPRATFPFRLRTFPIVSRRWRLGRNLSILWWVALLNLRLVLTRADFYHAHNTMFLPGMHLGARLHGGAFIYDAHEVQWEHGRAQTRLEELYIRRADAVINVSPGRIRVCAERFGLPPERFTLVSNYPVVDPAWQPPATDPVPGRVRLIFSGGYDLGSNRLDLLLEAMREVPEVELSLMAFGYRDGERVLRTRIAALELGERVRFLPLVAPGEVMASVARHDVAVNLLTNPRHHVSIRHASTNKMYEYLAAGVPILCSDLEGFVREFVETGAAFAVDASDPADIARGLRAVVAARAELPAMGARALELARTRFNWATQERNLLRLYTELGGRRRSGPTPGGAPPS
jgi:glycosyltransferase involved in cell wall biosynthesis